VFSLSVLEHVHPADRPDVYKDMYRVLRPGGYIVHSIDREGKQEEEAEYNAIRSAGFLLPPKADLAIRIRNGEGESTLFEPVCIVFRTYFGKRRKDMWTKLRSIQEYTPTILVVARKPVPNYSLEHDK